MAMTWKAMRRTIDRDALLERLGLERRTPAGDFFTGLGLFSVGVLVGAGLGLMFAPKRGEEMRVRAERGVAEPRPRRAQDFQRDLGVGGAAPPRADRVTELAAARGRRVRRLRGDRRDPRPQRVGAGALDRGERHRLAAGEPERRPRPRGAPRRAACFASLSVFVAATITRRPPSRRNASASWSLSAGGWRASTMRTTARSTSRPRR